MKLKGLTEVSLQIWAAGTHEGEFIERMGKNGLLTQAQNQFPEHCVLRWSPSGLPMLALFSFSSGKWLCVHLSM